MLVTEKLIISLCAAPLGRHVFVWGPGLHNFRQAFGWVLVGWRKGGRPKGCWRKKLKESAGRGVIELFDGFLTKESLQLLLRISLPWPWRCGMLSVSVECSD